MNEETAAFADSRDTNISMRSERIKALSRLGGSTVFSGAFISPGSEVYALHAYKSEDKTYTIETQTVVTKTFPNPQRVLNELKQHIETLVELKKILEIEGVAHMIIGFKFFEDARLQYSIESNGVLQLGSEIPIDKILLALGSPTIPLENVGASTKLERIREYVAHHQAKGKRVFFLEIHANHESQTLEGKSKCRIGGCSDILLWPSNYGWSNG